MIVFTFLQFFSQNLAAPNVTDELVAEDPESVEMERRNDKPSTENIDKGELSTNEDDAMSETCTDDHENAGIYSSIQKILPNAVVCIILVFVLYLIRMKKAEKKK